MAETEIPRWSDMPKPQPYITLSWEDIFLEAEANDIIPTREQVIGAFYTVKPTECSMECFWEEVKWAITSKVRTGGSI